MHESTISLKELISSRRNELAFAHKSDASGLASGMHFYRLSGGEFTATRKLLLMK